MAIDSAEKRASVIGYALPAPSVAPTPDGAISGVGDRAQLIYLYRGFAPAPALLSATVATDGNSVTLAFTDTVNIGVGGNAGWSGTGSEGAFTLTYSSGATSDTLVYTTDRTIDGGETGTVSYVQPGNGLEGTSGDDVASITNFAFANDSTADTIPPTVLSGSIDIASDTITFLMSEVVNFGAGGNGGFAITMSGGGATLTYNTGAGTRSLIYDISRSIAEGETGTYDYTQPGDGVEDLAGNDLATFSGATVTFSAELTHNNPNYQHNKTILRHQTTTLDHNDPTLDHNR